MEMLHKSFQNEEKDFGGLGRQRRPFQISGLSMDSCDVAAAAGWSRVTCLQRQHDGQTCASHAQHSMILSTADCTTISPTQIMTDHLLELDPFFLIETRQPTTQDPEKPLHNRSLEHFKCHGDGACAALLLQTRLSLKLNIRG